MTNRRYDYICTRKYANILPGAFMSMLSNAKRSICRISIVGPQHDQKQTLSVPTNLISLYFKKITMTNNTIDPNSDLSGIWIMKRSKKMRVKDKDSNILHINEGDVITIEKNKGKTLLWALFKDKVFAISYLDLIDFFRKFA